MLLAEVRPQSVLLACQRIMKLINTIMAATLQMNYLRKTNKIPCKIHSGCIAIGCLSAFLFYERF